MALRQARFAAFGLAWLATISDIRVLGISGGAQPRFSSPVGSGEVFEPGNVTIET